VIQAGADELRRETPTEKPRQKATGRCAPGINATLHVKGVVAMARGATRQRVDHVVLLCTGPAASADGKYKRSGRVMFDGCG